MPSDNPIRDLWLRIRRLGSKVEDELYDFTEEDAEREEEPRGRNTLIALLNGWLTMWKATNATAAERTLGVLGFAGLAWFTIADRGLGWRRWWLGIPAATFAVIWFVPGSDRRGLDDFRQSRYRQPAAHPDVASAACLRDDGANCVSRRLHGPGAKADSPAETVTEVTGKY